MVDRRHSFGGSWTTEKLDRVAQYLERYTIALKNQPFELMYVDAFAGTGYRGGSDDDTTIGSLFDMPELDELVKGSARIALEIDPPFDRYVFIEKNRNRFEALKALEAEFADQNKKMRFINQEANGAILNLCQETNWRKTRAVMFLDP